MTSPTSDDNSHNTPMRPTPRQQTGLRTGPRRVAPVWLLLSGIGTSLAMLSNLAVITPTAGFSIPMALEALLLNVVALAVALFASANDGSATCYSLLPTFVRNMTLATYVILGLLAWLASSTWAWFFVVGFSVVCTLETLRNVFIRYKE